MQFHLTRAGEVQACVDRDSCGITAGHWETTEKAVEQRPILVSAGLLGL